MVASTYLFSRKNGKLAFSMAELMVALSILGFVLGIVSSLFVTSAGELREIQAMMTARHIAEHQLSLLRLDAAQGMPLRDRVDEEAIPGLDSAERLENIHCLLTLQDADAERPGLKRAQVNVTWSSPSGRELEFRLESLIAERRR